ncbi:DNA-binding transcriptional LysR family regulator [Pullulanibacillus pueri]|uniref:HTH-type transcriptional regulator BsdA n=1 Tax=Pullulanibacillus pueri TaxID=1437324 RepID=A0A8J2ZTX3_9BACL|nr:LysR family transcriptional regulator [Pullulanibacillus pueri]MBM7680795.1 DNA-binding transcriptional LysR family regulator [Pullulanibacillus pueri]GGH78363.1 HTH-type transcriptional regulator BsdA [Pullulanibacillus pueri]
MDIRQLHYFCTIVEEEQITKAAKVLHMAQPPLSHQLKLLEEELGVPLIIREAKKWEVTEAGQKLYERAKQLLHQLEDTKKEIMEIEKGVSGTLTIGTSTICISYLSDHLIAFHKNYPNVYVKILHGDTYYLEEMLQENQIDLALLLLPVEATNYTIENLHEDPFVVVIPRQWEDEFPLDTISIHEVVEHDLLLARRTAGTGIYENIITQFQQYSLEPHIILDCPDISTILTLVAKGMGMTIIPKSEIHQVYKDQFKVLQIEEPFLRTQPAVVWLKDKYLSRAALELIKLLKLP